MRAAMSSSVTWPVATYVTGPGAPTTRASATSDLPERVPPSTSVINGPCLLCRDLGRQEA